MRDSNGRFIKGHSVPKSWRGRNRTGWKHTDAWKKAHSIRMLGNTFNCGRIMSPKEKEKNRIAQYLRYDRIGRCDNSATYRERRSKRYIGWRNSVFQRDGYRCWITGLSGSLIAHHVVGFGADKKLRYELSNGFTMLENLHTIFHRIYGFQNNTQEQLNEFIRVCQNLIKADILDPMANRQKKEVNKNGCSIGAFYEEIRRMKSVKFGEPFKMGIPSEASIKEERVETRRQTPIIAMGEGIVQLTNAGILR